MRESSNVENISCFYGQKQEKDLSLQKVFRHYIRTMNLQNISHVYKGLILRNRAFASFKEKEELETIYSDLIQYISEEDAILDPMSGYGGSMSFFGKKGYRTINIEINPPEYYWQLLINPQNTKAILSIIEQMRKEKIKLPQIKKMFSLVDDLFSDEAINNIKTLYHIITEYSNNNDLAIALLLPFVSRFANYQKSKTNITHFKQGGLCTYVGWEEDFQNYLIIIHKRLSEDIVKYKQTEHTNILSDIMKVDITDKFSYFITSPPYPNYRDYSKLFKIENWVLDNIILEKPTDFNMMIGSNNVSGKKYGEIHSAKANNFLVELKEKSEKLKVLKSRRDIRTYYLPYFAQYFYNIQESYIKLDTMLSEKAVGYIVVNDNITRDIIVPVGTSICDIFNSLGYKTRDLDTSQISHYGNIGKDAKRINSKHTRHIIKIWKE
jgi:hypothetical protein